MNELEIIRHPQIHGLHIFFDSMEYRTPHFHSEWELTCVMENDLFACIDAQQILMHPGDMILIEPKQLHEYRCADSFSIASWLTQSRSPSTSSTA